MYTTKYFILNLKNNKTGCKYCNMFMFCVLGIFRYLKFERDFNN